VKNANVLVLIIAAVLIVLVGGAGLLLGRQSPVPEQTAAPVPDGVTITPAAPEAGADTQAYLRVQVGGEVWPVIPLTDGGVYTVTQPEKGAVNVIHTTRTGAVMHSSTCENQNCVQQGEVTLSNRGTRVLGSLIVCLPNEVLVELLSPQEAGAQ